MKRISRAGRLSAVSFVTAGVLAAGVACAAPGRLGPDGAPAGSALAKPPGRTAVADPAPRTRAGVEDVTFRAAGSSTAEAVKRCRTEELRARVGTVDAGAGQRYAPLVLTNTSAKTCWVYGFVGLVMFDGNGDALRTRARRQNIRPQRVTLRPGADAHARLHWTVIQSGRETTCPASARLMIIPPDEVAHLEIPFTATVCDDGRLDVTPMAAGARL
ncbi:DUF4232 domain-containing protein [Streptosporangium sp. NPDC000396]|uniref:DUF4232 domain-containing protein n=1 Tax=Streptosporangium sp. NPDC000396 TaxID=3366185 RepID=UPI00368D3BDF